MHEPSGIQVFTVSGDGNFLFRAHCVGSYFSGRSRRPSATCRAAWHCAPRHGMAWRHSSVTSGGAPGRVRQHVTCASHVGREGEVFWKRILLDSSWRARFASFRRLEAVTTLRTVLGCFGAMPVLSILHKAASVHCDAPTSSKRDACVSVCV